jgi:hypothetical protein
VHALPARVNDSVLRAEADALIDQAVNATEFARDWRNRHLGHRDLALALNSAAQPLRPASAAKVSEALSAIHAVLNLISERLLQSTLAADVITPRTGAEALLHVIRDGLEADHARTARMRRGAFTEEDLRHDGV